MSDAQDAAWRLRQRRHADQTRRRLTRIFDADGDGLSDSTLPMFGQRTAGRQGPPPSPINLPVGESITVDVPAQEVPVGGKFLDLSSAISGPVRAGFGGYSGSGDGMPVSATAYYAVSLEGEWEETWEGGGRVEWFAGSDQVGEYEGPTSWQRLDREERRVGVVPAGTPLKLFVDHEDDSPHVWSGMATFELVDLPSIVVGDPAPEPPEFGSARWSTSTPVLYPDGTQEGDRLVMFGAVRHFSSTPTITTPSGWTQLATAVGNNVRSSVFTRVAGSETSVTPSYHGTNFSFITARVDPEVVPVAAAALARRPNPVTRSFGFSGFTLVSAIAFRNTTPQPTPLLVSPDPGAATLELDGNTLLRRGRLWSTAASGSEITIDADETSTIALGAVTWGGG